MFRLYNTMYKKKEVFKSLRPGKVQMFACGPSIYLKPHVGNYRTFLYEDVLQRYLEYLGYEVERILNFTDVEDKAMDQAKKEGTTLEELTNRVARQFFKDANLLKIKSPTYNPRSSTSVDQAVYLIKILLKKGYAYWHDGDVFYDPLKFKDFGKLYGLDMTKWPKKKRRFRKDTYAGRRWNLGDFILWRGHRDGDEVFWETEIGKGRPAWNIQDAAMAIKHLGFEVDLSCGGVDNLYRHHDYTIAVMEAVSGKEFARYWLHGEHLLIDGEKMSKSKGNIIYLDNLLREGYSPSHIRFYLIYGHYREKMNMSERNLRETSKKLDDFRVMIDSLSDGPTEKTVAHSNETLFKLASSLTSGFEKKMGDDIDVKGAFDFLFKTVREINLIKKEGRLGLEITRMVIERLKKIDDVLQVIFPQRI